MDPMGFDGFQICETLIVAQKVPTENIYQIQDVLVVSKALEVKDH